MLKKGRYQHYKGNFYEVLDEVTHSESEETLVLYRPLYGEMKLWVRPLEMFIQILPSGQKRFTFVSDIHE